MAKAKAPSAAVFRTVAVDTIVADPLNYNRQNAEMTKKLAASIKRFGCVDPLVVRENPDGNGGYMLIGGEHRLRACCFASDTPILTREGTTSIQDIAVGDEVLDGHGAWREVTAVSCTPSDMLTSVHLRRLCFPIHSTPDHPYVTHAGEIVSASSLKQGDWLFVPSPALNGVTHIAIPEIFIQESPRFSKCRVTQCANSVHASKLCFGHYRQWRGYKKPFTAFTPVTQQPCCSASGCVNTVKTMGLCTYHANRLGKSAPAHLCLSQVPHVYTLTRDLMWFFGLYIAEGCVYRGGGKVRGIQLSLGAKDALPERQYVQRAKKIAEECFGLPVHVSTRPEYNKIDITINSPTLGNWFSALFGDGAENKRIPPELMGTASLLISSLLEGWCHGDGHLVQQVWTVTTISRSMAVQAFSLARTAGFLPSLYYTPPKDVHETDGRVTHHRGAYCVRLCPITSVAGYSDSRRGVRAVPGGIELLVEKVGTHATRDIPVYNMTVYGSHTYTVWGVATHNCDVGLTEVPIMDVGAMDDAKAHLLMIALNETKGSPDQDALSALVKEIKEYDEMLFADLPLNDAQLADLLDADDDVPIDDEDDGSGGSVTVDDKPAKLKAADVGNALEIQGASQSDIARLLTAIRTWRVKQTDEAPAWRLLIDVLEGK